MRSWSALAIVGSCVSAAACIDPSDAPDSIVGPEWEVVAPRLAVSGGRWSVDMIKVGGAHACALEHDGEAYCWGSNHEGQVGDGTNTDRLVPTPVRGRLHFVEIDVLFPARHTCAVTADGDAYCWGGNESGQLGDGTRTNRDEPVLVRGGRTFKTVSVGESHTCALTESGRAWCWGEGPLGSSTTSSDVPVRVLGEHTFESIASGRTRTCALTASGRGYCWGRTSNTNDVIPVPVGGSLRFTSLIPGRSDTCGIATDGATYCWSGADAPAPVPGEHDFVALDDTDARCALDAIGDLYCDITSNPVALFTDSGLESFSGGIQLLRDGQFNPYDRLCALDGGGFAYCRGNNASGQLGNASTTHSPNLTPVFPPTPPGMPGAVTDLRIAARTATSITLEWTQVDDGTGEPAWYRAKYATPPMAWDEATVGCNRTMIGDQVGAEMSCTVEGLKPNTDYEFQLMSFRSEDGVWVAATYSGIVPGATAGRRVDDLRVIERAAGRTTVSWTEVDDGSGAPASYRLKHARVITKWREATIACDRTGDEIGTSIACTFSSDIYNESDTFEIQLMSFRTGESGVWEDARYSNRVVVPRELYIAP